MPSPDTDSSRCTGDDCPPAEDLNRLIDGGLGDDRATALTEHVGSCTGCQKRLDALAIGDDPRVSSVIRHPSDDRPPANSAMWKALSAAEIEVAATAVYAGNGTPDGHPFGDLNLDFLQPAEGPNRIGKLGPFDIIRVLGRGGMGVVLQAYDPSLQREIAIKVIDPQLANNDVARARFCREARAAAAVTHENLVAVHQVDEDAKSGLPYLVMQLVNGESLDQRLKRVRKLPLPDVARLGRQAAAGLAAAHAGGLIHRDIKPGNILLEAGTDGVKLTDFGLARAAEDVKLTRTGFVAGSPLYMAPEQARGEHVDARSDLFSLGSVLYEAATGTHPFDAKTPLAVLRRVADDTQPALRDLDPNAPQWLSDVIDRLLAKEPEDRFQTAAEVAEIFATELARAQSLSHQDLPTTACGGSRHSAYALRRRHPICWRKVAFRALLVIAGVIIGGVAVWLMRTPAPHVPEAPDRGPPPLVLLEAKNGPVWALAFTPDGNGLVTGTEDGSVKIWDWRVPQTRVTFEPRLEGNIWAVDVSPDGSTLVAACDNSTVQIYDLKTNQPAFVLPHPTSVKTAVFRPDGKILATGDRAAAIQLWDFTNPIPIPDPNLLQGQVGTVHALAYSPDSQLLASASSDGRVRLWEGADKKVKRPLTDDTGPVYALAFSPDRSVPRLATAGWDGLIRIWNPRTGAKLHMLKGHEADVWGLAFGAGGKILASTGSDGTIRIWDAETGNPLQVLHGSGRGFHSLRFAPNGTTLAAGGRDGNTWVWEIGGK